MTEKLLIELCRIIDMLDKFHRIPELTPNMKEAALWAVDVAESSYGRKPMPDGFPVPPWAPKPRPKQWTGADQRQHDISREDVMEGNA